MLYYTGVNSGRLDAMSLNCANICVDRKKVQRDMKFFPPSSPLWRHWGEKSEEALNLGHHSEEDAGCSAVGLQRGLPSAGSTGAKNPARTRKEKGDISFWLPDLENVHSGVHFNIRAKHFNNQSQKSGVLLYFLSWAWKELRWLEHLNLDTNVSHLLHHQLQLVLLSKLQNFWASQWVSPLPALQLFYSWRIVYEKWRSTSLVTYGPFNGPILSA